MEKRPDIKRTNEEIITEKFRTYQRYHYNKTVYNPNNLNRLQYDYYADNDLVRCMVVNDWSGLVKRVLNNNEELGDRTNRIDDTMRYINPLVEESIDKELIQSLNIEDRLALDYMQDAKQGVLSLFTLPEQNDNSRHHVIYPSKVDGRLNVTSVNIGESVRIMNINQRGKYSLELNTIQKIFGLATVTVNFTVYVVVSFFKELHVYRLFTEGEIRLDFMFRYTVPDFFVKQFNINAETSHVCILFENFEENSSEIHLIDINGSLIFRKVHANVFHRLQCYGSQDSILMNTHLNVVYLDKLLDKLQNLKSSDDADEISKELIYNVFNYNSCKIYGYVTSRYIKFFDYRFPKSGILSTPHHCSVPPESACFNKNPNITNAWDRLLTTEDPFELDSKIDQFANMANPNDRLFLYSVRKNGNILSIPHTKYKDNEDIVNIFAYNLVKEINFTNYKDNRFLNLLMHSSDTTRLFASSFKYKDMAINGVDVLRIDNKFVVFSLEEKSLLNIQVLTENKDKTLKPVPFVTSVDDLITRDRLEELIIEENIRIAHEMVDDNAVVEDVVKLSRALNKTSNTARVVDSNKNKQNGDVLTESLASHLKSSWN